MPFLGANVSATVPCQGEWPQVRTFLLPKLVPAPRILAGANHTKQQKNGDRGKGDRGQGLPTPRPCKHAKENPTKACERARDNPKHTHTNCHKLPHLFSCVWNALDDAPRQVLHLQCCWSHHQKLRSHKTRPLCERRFGTSEAETHSPGSCRNVPWFFQPHSWQRPSARGQKTAKIGPVEGAFC